jgi:hypothetical protein
LLMKKEWIGCSPNNYRQGRPVGFRPELIVIHVIVGSLLSADRWFNNPAASASAHYGVGCDGQVHQYVTETDTAFHAGVVVNPDCELVLARPHVNPNYYSIGIEHEGQPGEPWTDEQTAASAALIAEIAQRWSIPIDDRHVIQHHQIRASKKCPGGQQKVALLIARAQILPGQDAPVARAQTLPVQDATVARVPSGPVQPVPPATVPATPVPSVSAGLGEVRTVLKVRVRKGAPSTSVREVAVLPIHTPFRPAAAVIGESIQGNAAWYRDADGNFIWAGGTDAPHPTT